MAAAAMVALALVTDDFATYSQLHANLYSQVDSRLQTFVQTISPPDAPTVDLVGGFIETRGADDSILTEKGGDGRYVPALPTHISGYAMTRFNSEPQVLLTLPSIPENGPSFR